MPDILTAAALVPRLRGTPVILDVHDTFPELFATKFGYPQSHRLVRILELEESLSARLADHVITVTEEARRRLASRGVGRGQSSVVMNSPDERVFGAPRAPVALPAEGPVRVLYHGGLAPALRRRVADPRDRAAARRARPRRAARLRLRRGPRRARRPGGGDRAGPHRRRGRARAVRADPGRAGGRAHRRRADASTTSSPSSCCPSSCSSTRTWASPP